MLGQPDLRTQIVRPAGGEGAVEPMSACLELSTSYRYDACESLAERKAGAGPGLYIRYGNKAVDDAASHVARIEGADDVILFASGLAALTTLYLSLAEKRSQVVLHSVGFSQTRRCLRRLAGVRGGSISLVDAGDPRALSSAIGRDTAFVLVETPASPSMTVTEIKGVSDICRAEGVPLVIDSTCAGPCVQRPVALGASLTLHSGTKLLGGHADMACGVIAGEAGLVAQIRQASILCGAVLSPFNAWLLSRSLKTLHVRCERQCANALQIYEYLASEPRVARVNYPGSASPEEARIVSEQMSHPGWLMSFEVLGGYEQAVAVVDSLSLISLATSFGAVASSVELPHQPHSRQLEPHPDHCVIRLSVGLESVDDLLADLRSALETALPVTGV